MLVLSRQRDETIMIGDDIEITVVDIRGDKVRVGISAPRNVQVHRKEVYESIKRENTEAAQVRVDDLTGIDGRTTNARRTGRAPKANLDAKSETPKPQGAQRPTRP